VCERIIRPVGRDGKRDVRTPSGSAAKVSSSEHRGFSAIFPRIFWSCLSRLLIIPSAAAVFHAIPAGIMPGSQRKLGVICGLVMNLVNSPSKSLLSGPQLSYLRWVVK